MLQQCAIVSFLTHNEVMTSLLVIEELTNHLASTCSREVSENNEGNGMLFFPGSRSSYLIVGQHRIRLSV